MKISVVIPVYNGLNFLDDAIQSLLQQTYDNHEIIIIDDASTEDIFGFLCTKYMDLLDNKIIYMRNPQSRERCYSRNLGIDIATGNIITFLDHDDRFKQHHLQALYDTFKDEDVQVVYSDPEELIDYKNNFIGLYHSRLDDQDLVKSALNGALCVIGFAFKKAALCKIGKFNLETIQREDYELSCRTIIENKLYVKIIHSNSIQIRRVKSENFGQRKIRSDDPYFLYSKKVLQIIERYEKEKLIAPKYLTFGYIEVAHTAITFQARAYAFKLLVISLWIYPFRLDYLKIVSRLVKSFVPSFIKHKLITKYSYR